MLVGELATFKSYQKKNKLLAKQMDQKFIIKNTAPKKSIVGDAGDYVAIDTDGEPMLIKKAEFEETYEPVTE